MKDFENVGRLIKDERFTKNQLLDAANDGTIRLAAYAYGFFVWPARKTIGSHLEWYGHVRLCGAEYLSIARRYYKQFETDKPVPMGVFRSVANTDEYFHVRLRGNPESKIKPQSSFDALFMDAESIAKLGGKGHQWEGPAHMVAGLIRNDMLQNHETQSDIFPHPDNCGEGKIYQYLANDNVSGEYQINDDSREVAEVAAKKNLGSLVVRYQNKDKSDAVPFTKLMKAFREIRGR